MVSLQHVNTTDLRDAISLGVRTMSSVFNADDNDIPFMGSLIRPETRLRFSSAHSESHIPGRHLNALLSAEDAAGIPVDEGCIQNHANAAFFSYSGSLPLPLNRDRIGGSLVNFYPHNIREGFHALFALARYRDSAEARRLAEASIATIFEYWDPERGWDQERLQRLGLQVWDRLFVPGLARAIGPLVKLYRATRYGPALELAIVLKEKAVNECYGPDGAYDVAKFGTHGHSVTCVLSSLAQLADLTGDSPLMNRVKAFYDHGLWELRDELGWSPESTDPARNPDQGEANNTGDIVETALILGRWGYAAAYADAERILRGHLLPSQLRDISFIQDPPNPNHEDGKRDVANRHLGAWGFPAPYGHAPLGLERISFNMDIVGGVVGSLCEAYREATRFDESGHWVNLLFDHETEAIRVESPYTHAALCVTVKRPAPLFIRIPPWVDPQEIALEGATETAHFGNCHLFLAQPPVGQPIRLQFPLKVQEISLAHRTRPIRVRLRGDEAVAMDGLGADLTFFPPLDQDRRL